VAGDATILPGPVADLVVLPDSDCRSDLTVNGQSETDTIADSGGNTVLGTTTTASLKVVLP
jgi:hypothetical protein